MKDAIGSVFNLTLLFTFILLVSGFALFGVNYYKAFTVKNGILSNIEAYEGNLGNSNFKSKTETAIKNLGYNINSVQMNIINSNINKNVTGSNSKWFCYLEQGWCYRANKINKNKSVCTWTYDVKTFVSSNIPIVNRIFSSTKLFEVTGTTKVFKRRGACG
ncbi:MAG: hypothetical protein IKO49_08345 [Bacilli bacterium]|nr:hypothetical protein [Bacilli bacterium]